MPVVNNPIAACFLVRAIMLRLEERDAAALVPLRRAFKAYRLEAPSARAPVLLNAFYADLCMRTEAPEAAYDAARTAIIQINEINEGTRRGGPKRAENQWFILYWMRDVLSRLSPYIDSAAFELALAIPAKYSDLDLSRTNGILKDLFPVEQESAEQMDAWIEQQRQALSSPDP